MRKKHVVFVFHLMLGFPDSRNSHIKRSFHHSTICSYSKHLGVAPNILELIGINANEMILKIILRRPSFQILNFLSWLGIQLKPTFFYKRHQLQIIFTKYLGFSSDAPKNKRISSRIFESSNSQYLVTFTSPKI